MQLRYLLSLGAMVLLGAACAPVVATAPVMPTILSQPTQPAPVQPAATAQPAATEQAPAPPQATASGLSFQPATYAAPSEGFELQYPSDWTAVPFDTTGARGSQGLLFSPGSSADTLAEGGTRMGMTVYQWDPPNNLAALVEQRKAAWQSSGFTIAREDSGQLANGNPFNSYVIQTPDNHQAFFLFSTLGDKYLEISGEGNLGLVEEIARTVR